jgi:hypothetical protein
MKMKKYIVALISFFDNEIKQFGVEADSPYEAVKKAMLEYTSDEYIEDELNFQNEEEYPKTIDEMKGYFANGDMDFSVMEVGSFIN